MVLAPAALAIALRSLGAAESARDLEPVLFLVGLGLMVPLLALFLGITVLRDELGSGTIVHIATRPVRRETIVLARLLGAYGATVALSWVGLILASLVVGGAVIEPMFRAMQIAALAAAAYAGVFALMGALTKRAVLVGLAYLLLWENVVASTPLLFRTWTVAYWVRSIVVDQGLTSSAIVRDTLSGTPATAAASMVMLIVIAVATAGAGALWFSRRELPGAEPE